MLTPRDDATFIADSLAFFGVFGGSVNFSHTQPIKPVKVYTRPLGGAAVG